MGILKILGLIPEHLNLILAFACGVFIGVSKILIILHVVVLTQEQRENDHMEMVYLTFLVAIIATVAGSFSAWMITLRNGWQPGRWGSTYHSRFEESRQ